MRKTKIICTIGPSCENEDVIEEMMKDKLEILRDADYIFREEIANAGFNFDKFDKNLFK